MKHELPKLPWQADALTGAISATTIDFHYGKHTRTYLENVDKLAAETPLSELPLDGIVRVADGALLNNAAQAWNHLSISTRCRHRQSQPPTRLSCHSGAVLRVGRCAEDKDGAVGSSVVWLRMDMACCRLRQSFDGNQHTECRHPVEDGRAAPTVVYRRVGARVLP